jgi:hypothetical protein
VAIPFYSDAKAQTDAVPKARLLGLVLVPTRLILLLQAMLGPHRLLLRVLLAIIPPEVGLIKIRVTGGSEYLEQFCPKLGVVSLILRECEAYILAVNACSVLIIAVLVYLLRSLVAFSPVVLAAR